MNEPTETPEEYARPFEKEGRVFVHQIEAAVKHGIKLGLLRAADMAMEAATSALDLSRLEIIGEASRSESRVLAGQLVAFVGAIRAKIEEQKK